MKYFGLILVVAVCALTAMEDVRAARPRPGCICPAVYDPVCATNGRTYSNECRMKCAGATLAHCGVCNAD